MFDDSDLLEIGILDVMLVLIVVVLFEEIDLVLVGVDFDDGNEIIVVILEMESDCGGGFVFLDVVLV